MQFNRRMFLLSGLVGPFMGKQEKPLPIPLCGKVNEHGRGNNIKLAFPMYGMWSFLENPYLTKEQRSKYYQPQKQVFRPVLYGSKSNNNLRFAVMYDNEGRRWVQVY